MYSYGYKVPQLQDRIARTRQPDPDDIWVEDAVEREVVAAPVDPPVSSAPEVPQRSLSPREFFESQFFLKLGKLLVPMVFTMHIFEVNVKLTKELTYAV